MSKTTPLKPPSFAALVQQFFTEHLVAQRAVSAQTVAWYRDALLLFLDFASRKLGKVPTAMLLADVRPDLILAFLDHLEHGRHNAPKEKALAKLDAPATQLGRYKATDSLLRFLQTL
jgi:site-specific recombinase XerD